MERLTVRYNPDDEYDSLIREEMRQAFLDDPDIPLSVRFQYAQTTEDLKWIEHFGHSPLYKIKREQAARQLASNELYDEFCARLMQQSNVASWLQKRRRTPEIYLLHQGHDVGMSISFRLPVGGEIVALAWEIKSIKTPMTPQIVRAERPTPGATLLTTPARPPHGIGGTRWGQSFFHSETDPVDTAYDFYRRERDAAASPGEAAQVAASTSLTSAHPYAPTLVELTCWCRASVRHIHWSLLLRNIERSLRPGHTRVENGHIVATVPL